MLAGLVVDERGEPQAGVTVVAADQLTLTDERGRFELRLPAGAVTLELAAPWLLPYARTEQLTANARREVRYTLRTAEASPDGSDGSSSGELVEIEDHAPIEPGRQRLEASVARTVPGASGDVLKVVESLAGVARPAPGKAELVVWGAAPRDTQVLIDGVPVPSLYHAGGWRAALGGELVTDLVLEPGAFGPRYGGAIGGIIAVTTEAPAGDGVTLAADVLDAGGAIHRQIGQTRLAATGRWSYLDRIIHAFGDAGELVPVPAWGDFSAVAQTPVAEGGEGRLFALGSRDRLTRTVDSDDPAARKEQRLANDVLRAGAGWRGPAAGGSAQLTVYLGRDEERTALRFGEVPANLRTERWLAGARAEQVNALAGVAVLTLGADASLAIDDVHRDGSLGTPAREGDVAIFGQPPGDDIASDDWVATTGQLAIHGSLDWVVKRWTLSPGLRLDGLFLGASRLTPKIGRTPEVGYQHIALEPQPRLAARYRDGDVAVSVEGGLYAQPRQGADASAVFGTPSLGVEHAVHAAIGGAYRVGPLSLEATAYARVLYDLVARHPSATPPATGALTQDGEGTVLGGQLVLKLLPWRHLTGWLSYGASRSVRKDSAMAAERRFDHDQPHLITLVAGWQRGRWSLGARVRVASGEPRTEVIGAFVDARSGRYQPILGEHNGLRLPVFAQLDARAERRFELGGGELALVLEVQNVSSRRNAEEIVYSADYGDRGTITGLPVLAVLGARWQR